MEWVQWRVPKCHYTWNFCQAEMLPKKYHQNWYVAKTEMLPIQKCCQPEISLKLNITKTNILIKIKFTDTKM